MRSFFLSTKEECRKWQTQSRASWSLSYGTKGIWSLDDQGVTQNRDVSDLKYQSWKRSKVGQHCDTKDKANHLDPKSGRMASHQFDLDQRKLSSLNPGLSFSIPWDLSLPLTS